MPEERMSFTAAMKAFFGFRPGRGAGDFMSELKALTMEEKREYRGMLVCAGIECDPPTAKAGT